MIPAVAAKKKKIEIKAEDLQGFKKLKDILPLLADLHDVGCERDSAGNRELFFDQYVTLMLFQLMNPLLDSMRGLQQAAGLEKVAETLGVGRFSLGSFSESVRVYEPELLKQIIQQLAKRLHPTAEDPRLNEVKQILTAVDGTVLNAISTVAASWCATYCDGSSKHAWRLHTHFNILSMAPVDVELTDNRCSGDSDEKSVLRRKLEPDHCYIMDRGFLKYILFNEINKIGSSYVCRIRENNIYEVVEERPVSAEAAKAGVIRDLVVKMGATSAAEDRPDHNIHIIILKATPHKKHGASRRGKTSGPGNNGTIVIASNLLEVSAEVIALIYEYRWPVEIFFRFLKQLLGCRHLLSTRREGIEVQMYCAVIVCLLINLWTKAKPTKRTLEMVAFWQMGLASDDEMKRHIEGLQKESN
jgi:hypothetical protein